MSDPKEPGEDPIAREETAQPWGAGARPPRGKRTRLWAAVAAGSTIAAVAVGVAAWPVIEGLLPRESDPALGALAGRMDRLETALARIESARPADRSGENAAALMEIRATVSRLAARLDALEAELAPDGVETAARDGRIEALGERLAVIEQASAQPSPLAERLKDLERRVASGADPEARNASANETIEARAGLSRDLQAVADRLALLEVETARLADTGFSRKGDALLLAIGQLRGALAGGRPFKAELDAVSRIAGEHGFVAEAMTPIAPLAARGIETRTQLAARFPDLVARAAQAAVAPEEGDWIDRTIARFAQVVTIRRVGADVTGETAMAVLARAEAKLASGDLAGAEAALAPLGGKPAEMLAEWRAAAVARIAARTAIARLDGETIARLSRADDGGAR